MNGKSYTVEEATRLMERFCLYRERNHAEAESKLNLLGMMPLAKTQILTHLITEGYLNETRYAESFARGKAHIKKWGKKKIQHALKVKGISAHNIRTGLASIDEDVYQRNLKTLAEQKWKLGNQKSKLIKKQKVVQYLLQKGYAYDEINSIFETLGIKI